MEKKDDTAPSASGIGKGLKLEKGGLRVSLCNKFPELQTGSEFGSLQVVIYFRQQQKKGHPGRPCLLQRKTWEVFV